MGESEENRIRAELLRYYDSKSTAHVGYLVTLAVAFYSLVQLFVGEKAALFIGIKDAISTDFARVFRTIIFGIFFALSVHLAGRTLFWGYLSHFVLDAKFELLGKHAAFYSLHLSTLKSFATTPERFLLMRIAGKFQSFNLQFLLGLILIIFSALLLCEYPLKILFDWYFRYLNLCWQEMTKFIVSLIVIAFTLVLGMYLWGRSGGAQ